MPVTDGKYVSPAWENNTSPPINKTEMIAMGKSIAASTNATFAFSGKSVDATAWVSDTTYSTAGYYYRADISCAGVTSDYIPSVIFNPIDVMDANFASVANSGSGIVSIYARTAPSTAITIPSIICSREVVVSV